MKFYNTKNHLEFSIRSEQSKTILHQLPTVYLDIKTWQDLKGFITTASIASPTKGDIADIIHELQELHNLFPE